jgi:hypothetical protein
VANFQRAMMMDVDQAAQATREEEMLAEIEDFVEGFNQPTFRGIRINGHRVQTWSSHRRMSGLYPSSFCSIAGIYSIDVRLMLDPQCELDQPATDVVSAGSI